MLIYRAYGYICHQLPQRSWFLFGPKLTYTLVITGVWPAQSADELRLFVGTPAMGWKGRLERPHAQLLHNDGRVGKPRLVAAEGSVCATA